MQNRILILTNDPAEANALKELLGKFINGPFEVEWLTRLDAGIIRLHEGNIDAIIVDLLLEDSSGIDTFDQLQAAAPHTPIITLNEAEDEALALEASLRGAQAHLSKGHFAGSLVPQTLRSIIQRKSVEEAFYTEKARAEIALNSISDAVICTDISGNIDYLNIAAENITGWSREEARGHPVNEVFKIVDGISHKPPAQNPVHLVLKNNEPTSLNAGTLLIRRDGTQVSIEDSTSPIHDWNGKLTGVVIVFHDVSVAQAMAKKMAYSAQHDFLTDLPNRALLNDRISQAITLAKRHGKQLAVLFLDLDNFKHINDSLGHATGDKLLQSVTQRLRHCVRSSDTVSRQGGDEFVILLTESKFAVDATFIADKIITELTLPHSIGASELHITTSIGISIYPEDGEDADSLVKNADTAMYHAKANGRNNYQFFSNEMNVRAVERQFIETHLRVALENQEFILYYQPKTNLTTGEITGAEALLRWDHPEWGIVMPQRFISVAEDCGLIVAIGNWALREACLQVKKWQDLGLSTITIAVNISAIEFRQNSFVQRVRTALMETGLSPKYLQLEITESVLMHDAATSVAILNELKSMGVQLAMDDFGTGYSSLSYLKQFPIDVLKIDQSFVHDIRSATDKGIIVSAVVGMANSLELSVVAEGVENHTQLTFLKKLKCKEGQGYFFSQPVIAEQFSSLLKMDITPWRCNFSEKTPSILFSNKIFNLDRGNINEHH
ncbi:MAG: EAL domain-containing protein [Bacteroidia bacterium]|nr:EAL domain-containing protein [Methylotenera sp.]